MMIIAKAPLRISIAGGGTDLPSYYESYGSMFISAAINQYVYVAVHKSFTPDIILSYKKQEKVTKVDDIEHPIIKAALKRVRIDSGIEIHSFADIPSGTGLGSSGAFTVALLAALYEYTGIEKCQQEIAADAYDLERNDLGSSVGKQDQYISALGGFKAFYISKQGKVTYSFPYLPGLSSKLLLYFTGEYRDANPFLARQEESTYEGSATLEKLHETQEIATYMGKAINDGDFIAFGRSMHEHWVTKKRRDPSVTNPLIDKIYETAISHGALGGKLVGAGGGGFLLFVTEKPEQVRQALKEYKLQEIPVLLDHFGVSVHEQ